MVDAVNRTTKEFRASVNTPDFPLAQWIHESPGWLDAVAGFEPKYWIITGDVITLMSPAERSAVDAAELAAAQQTSRDQATLDADQTTSIGYNTRALIETLNKRDNYIINRLLELQAHITELRDAIRDSTGPADGIRTAAGGVDLTHLATNTRTKAETVQTYKDEISGGGAEP